MEKIKENNNHIELFTSKNGSEYSVSFEEKASVDIPNETKHLVNWIVDGQWHDTDSTTLAITKIKKYKIDPNNPGWFNNKLYFENDATYCYYFEDRTNDVYKVNTYIRSVHAMAYNSKDPRIIAVTTVKY